jgi:hypothetical protein
MSIETAALLNTSVMTLTVEANMDAGQEVDRSEGMTNNAAGPFNITEDVREICGG